MFIGQYIACKAATLIAHSLYASHTYTCHIAYGIPLHERLMPSLLILDESIHVGKNRINFHTKI